MPEQGHDDDRRGDAGGQGANTRAGGPHVKAVDKDGVDHNIDDVDNQGTEHGDLAVAHGPEQGGPGVVDAHKGVGRGGKQEVDQGAVHHVGLHTAEDQGEDVLPEHQGGRCQQQGEGRHGI